MKVIIDKFVRNNILFILILLATAFAFVKKATIWQQPKDSVKASAK
jgi:hypothetical protein